MFSEEMFVNRAVFDSPWWNTGAIANEYAHAVNRLYLTNTSLRAAMFQPIGPEQTPCFGHQVETAVSAQFGIGEDRAALRYARWKDGRADNEIDFIRLDPGPQQPNGALGETSVYGCGP